MSPGLHRAQRRRGFVLLPVVIVLCLVATVAFLVNRNAGMNMTLAARGLQADSARYVAEAGLAQANYRAQNASCANYPALTNVAFGADSFSASVAPTSGTPVTLTATATTAAGAKATLTRASVPVYWTTPYTKTLQPATVLQDSYIESTGGGKKNYGASTTLVVENTKHYPLLRFDLSTIPSTAYVQSAQLMLYKSSGGAGPAGSTITAYPLTRSWVEGTQNGDNTSGGVTWNTTDGITAWTSAGGDYDTSVSGVTASTGTNNTWLTWDITTIVSNWVSGATTNNGVILIPSASVPSQNYVSGDDTSQRANTPKLIVTFLPRCDWATPSTGVTLAAAADSYIDGNSQLSNYGIATSLLLTENAKQRVVARFDTSSIAPGTLITSAKLRYYVTGISNRSGNTMNLEAHAITTSWAEGITNGGITDVSWKNVVLVVPWSNAGGDFGSTAASLALASTFNGGWIEFDITALAQNWVDGVQANYGAILLESTKDAMTLASREAGANTPQLVLSW